MPRLKRIVLFILLFIGIERFCYFKTGGFALSKMTLASSATTTPSISVMSDDRFSKPLIFIGAGKQFYAFETSDGKSVVKFMKMSRRKPLPWLEKLHLHCLNTWKTNYLSTRAKRLSNLESSSFLALSHLTQETGLIPISPHSQIVTLIDKLGIRHTINLSNTRFVIQKKAIPFTTYVEQNPDQIDPLLISYIRTVASQCSKGICNLDPLVERNFGVVADEVICIDIGSFLTHDKLKSTMGLKREILIELLPLREWLQKNHPEHLPFFDEEVKKIIKTSSIHGSSPL